MNLLDQTVPATSSQSAPRKRVPRWMAVVAAVLAALLLLLVLFDWNWLRQPLERYISKETQREFRISDLDVDLGWNPTIKMKDVFFANVDWAVSGAPMAQIGSLEFSVSLRGLWDGKVLVPRVALSRADLVFERSTDKRRNWVIRPPSETAQPGWLRIASLSVDQGRVRYFDHGEPMFVDVSASTFDPAATAQVADAKSQPDNRRYTTRYAYKGHYHEAGFSGEALTGDVLSFQQSGTLFPIKASLKAGTTRAEAEGTVADVLDISAIDVQLHIAGSTLASLYPFLLLPLPASPPYDFRGHLVQKGDRYAIDDLRGKIGVTDMAGSAAYLRKEPRPLLTAQLSSRLLNIADLGPIIGLQTKDTGNRTGGGGGVAPSAARPRQADTNTRAQAQTKERQTAGDKILPTGTTAARGDGILPGGRFEGGRLKAIDAEVDYVAAKVQAPNAMAVEDMKFSFRLNDGVAKLVPLEFGYAGGRIVSDITIDARQDTLRSVFNVDFRKIQLARLFPALPAMAKGVGAIGAQIRLSGSGNSIADAAGNAHGSVTAAIANGRISNLIDAFSGLNGGKIIPLFLGGDKDIALNCGAVSFAVKDGIGRAQLLVVDTAQTRIDGTGTISFKDERIDMTLEPKPKRPGILSLRTPVHVFGSFRSPDYSLEKGPLLLRAGAAVALAVVNPLAALIPLIETGPGQDTDCARLLAPVQGARQQARTSGKTLPKANTPGSGGK